MKIIIMILHGGLKGWFPSSKNIEFGYTLPKTILSSNSVNARMYLTGLNLLSFSDFNLWDIEMAGNGLGYPPQRVFNVGLQISF